MSYATRPMIVPKGKGANVSPTGVRHHEVGRAGFIFWQFAPWIMGGILAIGLTAAGLMVRKELLYASVGRSTCGTLARMDKPEYRNLWVIPDETSGIVVPIPDIEKIKACEAANRLF